MARAFFNLGASPGSKPIQINSYTTSGNHVFTVPANCTHIEVWGTGGGGGGGGATNNWNNAGGGRAGASFYLKIPATALSSATYSLTVGSGGNGRTGSGQGNAGYHTQMFGIRANGGPGGAGAQNEGGQGNLFATAGVQTAGDCPISTSEVMLITGGQCSIGSGGNTDDDPSTYGNGASSIWGSGGGGGARGNNTTKRTGRDAKAYGSGGGGSANTIGNTGNAGAGRTGIVLIISYGA